MKGRAGLLVVIFTGWTGMPAARAGSGGGAPAEPIVPVIADVVAIAPPVTVMTGRVLMKDGVTPIPRAEVTLVGAFDDTPRVAQSNRSGRFKVKLPVGQYRLQVAREMEIYKAPSVFRVPAGQRVEIDLLLLPDFEKAPGDPPGPQSMTRGPDPVPSSPSVVGSVVDMVRPHASRRWGRWAEVLGFVGSLLAVAAAAD